MVETQVRDAWNRIRDDWAQNFGRDDWTQNISGDNWTQNISRDDWTKEDQGFLNLATVRGSLALSK